MADWGEGRPGTVLPGSFGAAVQGQLANNAGCGLQDVCKQAAEDRAFAAGAARPERAAPSSRLWQGSSGPEVRPCRAYAGPLRVWGVCLIGATFAKPKSACPRSVPAPDRAMHKGTFFAGMSAGWQACDLAGSNSIRPGAGPCGRILRQAGLRTSWQACATEKSRSCFLCLSMLKNQISFRLAMQGRHGDVLSPCRTGRSEEERTQSSAMGKHLQGIDIGH